MRAILRASVVISFAAINLLLASATAAAPELENRMQRRCDRAGAALEALEQGGSPGRGPGFRKTFLRRFREGIIAKKARRIANRCLRINEIQVLGSHNSYHIEPRPELLAVLVPLAKQFGFASPLAWEYTHLPLAEQFATQGIRQIELDVFADPKGGLYDLRRGLEFIAEDPNVMIPALLAPGMKVLHVQHLDFESTCLTFVQCLQEIRAWSQAHRRHLPIAILIEAKDEVFNGLPPPVPFDADLFDALDAEIRQVFAENEMITPDDVRGRYRTLEDAVLDRGWPTLRRARGKVMFLLDNGGAKRDLYRAGRPSLDGRVLFTSSTPGEADAAFVKLNDPVGAAALIPDLVEAGYLVRTRADGDTEQARSGDTTQRDAAISSGAHFVSTDYPVENPDFGTGYRVEIPGGATARCNPLNAPSYCRSAYLEPPIAP